MLISEIIQSESSEQLLLEAQLVEGFLDTAKSYLGTSYNKVIDDIKGAISDVKRAGILIKDAFSCAPVFDVMSTLVGKAMNSEVKRFFGSTGSLINKLPEQVVGAYQKFVAFLRSMLNKVFTLPATAQFLARLALYGFVKYMNELTPTPANISSQVMGTITDKVTELVKGVIPKLSMPAFMTFIDTLQTVKTYFLDILTDVKKKIDSVPAKFRPQAKCQSGEQQGVTEVARLLCRHSQQALIEHRKLMLNPL